MQKQITSNIENAILALHTGNFILIHDSAKRENEIDMMVAAQFITPQHIATMRKEAGGLICVTIDSTVAQNIGLEYMHDTLFNSYAFDSKLKSMIYGVAPYGDHPTFSMWINHRNTHTGITDFDRALTIKEMASVCNARFQIQKDLFISSFKTPGHVPLLLAENGLIQKRQGHTEMSVFLTKTAQLTPSAAICEMMDSQTHTALSIEKAKKYSTENKIPLLDLNDLMSMM